MAARVTVKIPGATAATYPILIGAGLLQRLPTILKKKWPQQKIVLISDRTVMALYGKDLARRLKKYGRTVATISFSAGESSKSHSVKQKIEAQMFAAGCGRDTVVIALGGGIVGDLAGYVAATYMRGLTYIQVPTTLLAMVDSSVGGKTGIDTPYGKNLIGAFWQPKLVLADTNCLKTLPRKHVVNGLIESIKMFLTHDASSFNFLRRNLVRAVAGDARILAQIIQKSVKIKAGVVQRDEKEANERMTLNLGHTIGHAIEHVSRYKVMHGMAVALGVLVEAKIAVQQDVLNISDFTIIQDLLAQLGVTTRQIQKRDIQKIIAHTALDKKSESGQARYVLLSGIGRVHKTGGAFAHPVANVAVRHALGD